MRGQPGTDWSEKLELSEFAVAEADLGAHAFAGLVVQKGTCVSSGTAGSLSWDRTGCATLASHSTEMCRFEHTFQA